MPLQDIAIAHSSLQNHLGGLRAQYHVHCKVFPSPFTFHDNRRLLSVVKSIQFHGKVNAFERSKLQIKAVATVETKSLVRKGNGCRRRSCEDEQVDTNSDTLMVQVEPSHEDSMDLNEREKLRRKRISRANKGNMPWNKGRKHSPETLQKIRERTWLAMQDPKVKEKLANLGHAQSEETRVKIGLGVRLGWQKRREKQMVQETCYFEWQNLIAEESRKGYSDEEELQWDSYNIVRQQLEVEWVESIEQRKSKPKPKGSKRAPKSLEQRRKISEAIAAKWADPVYRERVYSGLSRYHSTPAGAERKRRPSGGTQSAKQDSTKKRISNTEKGDARSMVLERRKMPLYKDPQAKSKLEMIKNIRAQRTATKTKKNAAIERARSLIAEAEKAANALETAALKSPIARASLIEARNLIAEAIQSIEAIDAGDSVSDDSISNENGRVPSHAPKVLVSEVEQEIIADSGGCNQVELVEVNGTKIPETSKHEDLTLRNLGFHDILKSETELLPISSSVYSLRPLSLESLAEHPSSGKQPDQVKLSVRPESEMINTPNGSKIQSVREDTASKPVPPTMKWIHGRLVEVTEGE